MPRWHTFLRMNLLTILSEFKEAGNTEKIYIGSFWTENKKFKFFNTFRRRVHYLLNYLILRNDLGAWELVVKKGDH